MQLTPVYGADPLIVLDGPPSAVLEPVVRQRRRLVAALGRLDDDQWGRPTRCEGWDARDVIVHLDSTNSFWSFSIGAGVAGTPTTFLSTFDPVASPATLVADNTEPPAVVLERFAASTEALVTQLESLDDDGWRALAEAPPGHVTVAALAHHALWDSWVHERDILLPLGIDQTIEADEVAASLAYAAALSPAFSVALGRGRTGVLGVATTDPALELAVEVDQRVRVVPGPAPTADLVLRGDAVELLEALSVRRPLNQPVPAGSAWMVQGLLEIFDVAPGAAE
jgi:uncharacterized protein (TIGR03083 family)